MGSDSAELGLDLKLCAVKAADGLLRELPTAIAGERAERLEEALRGLEEERGKMEAFKRELPFSIRLVAHVVEILKEELDQCRSERCNVIEEFIPIKSKFEEEEEMKLEKDCKDKMNWMSSAQLWSNSYSDNSCKKDMQEESKKLSLDSKSCGGGGAFVPFKVLPSAITAATPRDEEKVSAVLPDLSLMSAGMKRTSRPAPAVEEEHHFGGSSSKMRAPVSSTMGGQLSLQAQQLQLQQQQQQTSRKARRCWSPELHRRFVLALQQLGGAQVATPKQIRELMKVDGLTNDEVKSHLQKYRLHTRRVPNSSAQGNQQVVMMGGMWVPRDHYPTSSKQSASQSGSPQGPLQLAGSAHAVSVTAGDSCEEDGKSESYSWK